MFLDPITASVAAIAGVVLWQQWNMIQVQRDLDEVINAHNDFVNTMIEILEEADKQ